METLVLPCPGCKALNRVPKARLVDVPVCSSCRAHLLPDHPVSLTASDFDRYVESSDLPVVVDFWAPWCGPCLAMAPQFEQAASILHGKALLAKVDTDQQQELATRFLIRGIPTMVVLHNGSEMARVSGAQSAPQITDWVLQVVAKG